MHRSPCIRVGKALASRSKDCAHCHTMSVKLRSACGTKKTGSYEKDLNANKTGTELIPDKQQDELQINGDLVQRNGFHKEGEETSETKKEAEFIHEYKWSNIFFISAFHLVATYAFFTSMCYVKWQTILWAFFLGGVGGFGVTGGVHRLWTHRAYSATWQLRTILALCYSIAGQNTIFDWVRDHRIHHKFSETDADPHNANRGFFFAHVGWLMQKKHPDVIKKGSLIDMSDILEDPVVQIHMKYFVPIKIVMCFVIPMVVPRYLWDETWYISIMTPGFFRYMLGLNFTWLVNSAAHIWGNKPYDRRIGPVENVTVAILAMGEGWHNYHHVFPWDYKAAELGDYSLNVTTFWIDLFAKIGWAYNLKSPSAALVKTVAAKHGDGSFTDRGHHFHSQYEEVPPPVTPFDAVHQVFKYVIHNNKSVK